MQISMCFVMQLSVLDKYEHVLAKINGVAMERLVDHEGQLNILTVCEDPQVLAQQLCHVELVSGVVVKFSPKHFVRSG